MDSILNSAMLVFSNILATLGYDSDDRSSLLTLIFEVFNIQLLLT